MDGQTKTEQDLPARIAQLEQALAECRRAEESVRADEARFRIYFELPLAGRAITSPTQGWLQVNTKLCEMLGYTRDELMQTTWAELTYPDDLAADLAQFNRVLAGEIDQYTMEKRFVRKDGRIVPTDLAVHCVRRSDGAVDYFVVLIQDITERKQAEAALREERNLLRTMIDTIPDQVFAKDLAGRYAIYNRAHAQVLGVSDLEFLVGKTDWDVFPSESASTSRNNDQFVMIANQPVHREEPSQDAHGNARWVMASKAPWHDQAGHVIGVIGIATNLTERKEMEQQLQHANEKLMVQVDQLHEIQAQLREQAIRDPLTQLYNRRYLNETLPREIARAIRQDTALGFVMLDLDHFKHINDTYGHAAGDEALQTIARIVQTQLRASDIVCRYGGEEILCLLIDTTEEIACRRAEELRAAIAEAKIIPSNPAVRLTASIGVALLPPDGTETITILKAADEALYHAKANGRNCVRMARTDRPPR